MSTGSAPRGFPLSAAASITVTVVALSLLPLIVDGGGLGHDEAAYALKARHWLEGTPETGWGLHRGIAMSGYGFVVLGWGGTETHLRALGLVSLVGLAAATWALGRRLGGRWVGPVAAMAVVASPRLLRRGSEFLSDVPSAALLVVCMVLVWREFGERDVPSYRLLGILPFAWAAFYLRYQSALSFLLIAITVAALFWDKMRRGWRPVLLLAGVGLLGLLPHFLYAVSETGSPLGILLTTADVAGREFYGEGLLDYFLLMGWPLAGFVGPIAATFFVWWTISSRNTLSARLRSLFLLIPVVGQVLALGILSHGEARFIFFPLALTFVGGAIGVFEVSGRWRPQTRRVWSIGLALILVGSVALSVVDARNSIRARIAGTETIEASAEMIRDISDSRACGAMTSYLPQITYYSACFTSPFSSELDPAEAVARLDGERKFLLLVEGGKRQPMGSDLSALLDLADQAPREVAVGRDSALIYEFNE